MIGVIATLNIKEGKGAEFETLANQLVEKVNANEEGVVYYDLYKQDPTTYVFLERYKDQAAKDAHGKTDYFKEIGDEINIIAKEINGPSWGPKKDKINIDELQKKIDQNDNNSAHQNSSGSNEDSIKAVSMIRSYRQRGHIIAKLDPLELLKSEY